MTKLKGSGIKTLKELAEERPKRDFKVTSMGAFKTNIQEVSQKQAEQEGTIFKFQAPLLTMDQEPKILVYNENKTWTAELPLSEQPEMQKIFAENGGKFYALCIPDVQGRLIMLNFVPNQEW